MATVTGASLDILPPFSKKIKASMKELEDAEDSDGKEALTIFRVSRKRMQNNSKHEDDDGRFSYASHG